MHIVVGYDVLSLPKPDLKLRDQKIASLVGGEKALAHAAIVKAMKCCRARKNPRIGMTAFPIPSLRMLSAAFRRATCRSQSVRLLQTPSAASSVNADEIAHFSRLSSLWWDEHGEFALLHRMNPTRVQYIREKLIEITREEKGEEVGRSMEQRRDALRGLDVLDVGCGGGLLSEVRVALSGLHSCTTEHLVSCRAWHGWARERWASTPPNRILVLHPPMPTLIRNCPRRPRLANSYTGTHSPRNSSKSRNSMTWYARWRFSSMSTTLLASSRTAQSWSRYASLERVLFRYILIRSFFPAGRPPFPVNYCSHTPLLLFNYPGSRARPAKGRSWDPHVLQIHQPFGARVVLLNVLFTIHKPREAWKAVDNAHIQSWPPHTHRG